MQGHLTPPPSLTHTPPPSHTMHPLPLHTHTLPLSLSHTASPSLSRTHTHTDLRSPGQCQPSCQEFLKAVSKLGGGLCLLFRGAPGGSDHFTPYYVESSGSRTEVALESLIGSTTCVRELDGEGRRTCRQK